MPDGSPAKIKTESIFVRRVLLCADPNWLAFMAVFSLPAIYELACALFSSGDARSIRIAQAEFFFGLAVYAGVLKWLGWNIFTRWLPDDSKPHSYALFPAEIFCGLALACAWFYLRNFIGALWPASYSLLELSVLKYLATAVHLIALVSRARSRERVFTLDNLRRTLLVLSMYAACVLALFLALRDVSPALHVQSTDPFYHAYSALMYLRHGVAYSIFNGGEPLVYTSGFGAINAVAAAVAPLSVVRAVAIQHIFLIIVAFFLMTSAIGAIARRPLWLLHWTPLPFLLLLPVHNLAPWIHYEGAPRQCAPALLAAIVLLPTLLPATRAKSLYAICAVVAVLEGLAAALNPVCVPFLFVLAPVSLGALCFRARAAKMPLARIVASHAGALLVIGALLLYCDQYYRRLAFGGQRPSVSGQVLPAHPIKLNSAQGLAQMASARPLAFDTSIEEIVLRRPRLQWFPFGALALLGMSALVWFAMGRHSEAPRVLLAAAMSAGVWFVLKYLAAFLIGALSANSDSWDASTLCVYLKLMLFRIQVVLLFFVVASCASILYACADRLARPARIAVLAAAAVAIVAILPWRTMIDVRKAGFDIPNSGCMGNVSVDDLKLVKWADRTIGNGPGIIGLAATTVAINEEKHLYPFSGAQAMPLYSEWLNYCFLVGDPKRKYSFDDYMAHIQTNFDARWCFDNGIAYFYINRDVRSFYSSFDDAIAAGKLKALQTYGNSTIYAVVAEPAPPPK
ncbi:MAG TPA: hypothetical protein VKX17_12960 [Planctomycetota bacterium]|nr:hypothetical protein [Planctomycetota bacterium]